MIRDKMLSMWRLELEYIIYSILSMEKTNMDMPDFIDSRKDLDVKVIKQEEFEKIKIDARLEGTSIDMPDVIGIRKDLHVTVIKEEELSIKSESADSCDYNM